MNTNQATQQEQQEEQTSFGMPSRLFDGYDGDSGREPPDDFIQQLLASAPPEARARAEEFARQQQGGQAGQPEQDGEENREPVAQG